MANLPVARDQNPFVDALQITDGGNAVARQAALQRLADAPQDGNRLVAQEVDRLGAADYSEAARLVEVRGDLGEELVVAQTDRDGDADLALDAPGQHRQCLRRCPAMQPFGAGEVEEGFVDRDRLDQRGDGVEQRADLAADRLVMRHPGWNDDGVGTSAQRLEHRHRRMDAELPGDVARRRDDAAMTPADHHRTIGQRRVVALLDAGIEGVAVDMGDRQGADFGMRDEARSAAAAAGRDGIAGIAGIEQGRAIAANRWHHRPRVPTPAPRCYRPQTKRNARPGGGNQTRTGVVSTSGLNGALNSPLTKSSLDEVGMV